MVLSFWVGIKIPIIILALISTPTESWRCSNFQWNPYSFKGRIWAAPWTAPRWVSVCRIYQNMSPNWNIHIPDWIQFNWENPDQFKEPSLLQQPFNPKVYRKLLFFWTGILGDRDRNTAYSTKRCWQKGNSCTASSKTTTFEDSSLYHTDASSSSTVSSSDDRVSPPKQKKLLECLLILVHNWSHF